MSNLIADEFDSCKQYLLVPNPANEDLVELSRDNVARVEAIIRIDSSYVKSSDPEQKPIPLNPKKKKQRKVEEKEMDTDKKFSYQGSTAFWMTQLRRYREGEKFDYPLDEIIANSVESVDRENSTHLNADKVGRAQITARLQELSLEQIIEMLLDTDYYPLVRLLTQPTVPEANYRSRFNFSFATKYCHYACYYLFKGTEQQDLYSIYDKIVATALPKYIQANHNKDEFLTNSCVKVDDYLTLYRKYQKSIGDIISRLDEPISRNGFDHLLWYFHKGKQ